MQRINIDIENITVFINDPYRFLHFAVCFNFLQPAIGTHTVIDVRYIIAPAATHAVFLK